METAWRRLVDVGVGNWESSTKRNLTQSNSQPQLFLSKRFFFLPSIYIKWKNQKNSPLSHSMTTEPTWLSGSFHGPIWLWYFCDPIFDRVELLLTEASTNLINSTNFLCYIIFLKFDENIFCRMLLMCNRPPIWYLPIYITQFEISFMAV